MKKLMYIGLILVAACGDPTSPQFVVETPPEFNGADGSSCSVTQIGDGTLITCTDGTSAMVYNGSDGEDGAPGPQGPAGPSGDPAPAGLIADYIDPCGDDTANVDEVIFILNDGRFAAWYKDVGIVILGDGNYVTTDKQKCNFTVSGTSLTW